MGLFTKVILHELSMRENIRRMSRNAETEIHFGI